MRKKLIHSALILVDIQNDFCPGGALAVPQGDEVVDVINQLIDGFSLVVATQDWHPENHISFKDQGGIWPPHCVQNTAGAQLHSSLKQQSIDRFFRKALAADKDSYSGFDGIDERGRWLDEVLRAGRIKKLYITGLATDYCVKETALDGLRRGYQVFIVTDAIRAVNVDAGDGDRALQELETRGARLIRSREVIKYVKAARASLTDAGA
jgi:nicotinamidase/pyrazinamidase